MFIKVGEFSSSASIQSLNLGPSFQLIQQFGLEVLFSVAVHLRLLTWSRDGVRRPMLQSIWRRPTETGLGVYAVSTQALGSSVSMSILFVQAWPNLQACAGLCTARVSTRASHTSTPK